jgi:hypothetical protein
VSSPSTLHHPGTLGKTQVCKNVQVNVTATSATSACSVSIGANIFDTSATGFFDTASLGTTATTALLTAVNGTLLAAPQQYPQGTYSVQAQVRSDSVPGGKDGPRAMLPGRAWPPDTGA